MSDPVRKPAHYIAGRSIEPIDVIEDWELGFHLGNALKYISRAGRKEPSLIRQDISKAIWYLERFSDQFVETEAQAKDADTLLAILEHEFTLDMPLTTPGGLRSPQSRRADYCDDQEEVEYQAMGELGSRSFGSDEDIPFDTSWDEDVDSLWDPSLGPVDPLEPVDGKGNLLYGKDLSKFGPQEIVNTYQDGDMILGVQKNGDVRILKHSESLYDELDTLPSELER